MPTPYAIALGSAVAPEKLLSFLFSSAGVFVSPEIVVYTAVVDWLFRGNGRVSSGVNGDFRSR
ncbi:MAG: hypothetical protein ACLQBA_18660 [Candidatus Binataceae bacterium]